MQQHLVRAALAALLLAGAPAFAGAETIAITGGDVHPVSSAAIPGGTVLIRNGRIVAVGAHIAIPAGARIIDARGKMVTPGFINAETQLGLVEVGGERPTRNSSAVGVVNAGFRPWEGFNSTSAYIASTREDGITSVGVFPTGGFISGQAAVVDLAAGTGAEMLLRGPIGVVATLQTNAGRGGDVDEQTAGDVNTAGDDMAPASRGEAVGRLREIFDDVRFFARNRNGYDRAATRPLGASRAALEALRAVAEGRLPLFLHANRVDDIDAAVRLAGANHIKLVITGGAEAWRIAGRLAAAHVPVITGAMNNIPTSFDTLAQRQENAGLLRRAGVEVALVGNAGGGDEDAFNARNVRYEAGNAVAYGMNREDALRAVTLGAARILGVADHIGALAPGLDANVVVWSGDPFEFATAPEHVLVRGREYHDRSRQDILTERYAKRR